MPVDKKYVQDFEPQVFYHIYNRTNNVEPLFKNDANRLYFLKKYAMYLSGYVKTYAYCLMDNHFHLLVRIEEEATIINTIKNTPEEKRLAMHQKVLEQPEKDVDLPSIVNKQFNRWFTAYAMAFNKQQQRKGNLFHRPFKRLKVRDDVHLMQLVYYIHANPSLHKVHLDFMNYRWSSYQSLLSNKATLLQRKAVINWFGGRAAFIKYHQILHGLDNIKPFVIESD